MPKKKLKESLQSELEIAKYDTIEKIVAQLEKCNYECEAGTLKTNVAFIALKRKTFETGKAKSAKGNIIDRSIMQGALSKIISFYFPTLTKLELFTALAMQGYLAQGFSGNYSSLGEVSVGTAKAVLNKLDEEQIQEVPFEES